MQSTRDCCNVRLDQQKSVRLDSSSSSSPYPRTPPDQLIKYNGSSALFSLSLFPRQGTQHTETSGIKEVFGLMWRGEEGGARVFQSRVRKQINQQPGRLLPVSRTIKRAGDRRKLTMEECLKKRLRVCVVAPKRTVSWAINKRATNKHEWLNEKGAVNDGERGENAQERFRQRQILEV